MSKLVVALDFKDGEQALGMARKLKGIVPWAKVGLELFTIAGPRLVGELKDMGFKVFLDLKFFDIPNTVQGAVRSAATLGADIVDIHALGGRRMAEAALEGAEQGARPGCEPPLILAITVLTSMGPGDLPVAGNEDPSAMALDLAMKAKQYGLGGVVCSGLEVERIMDACGSGFSCLTPGIRPAGAAVGDQRRVVTPAQAVRSGARYLVVGRPITGADDPVAAARMIVGEMNQVA